MCGIIRRALKTLKETLLKLYKGMAVPVLLYGSEVRVLTREDESLIDNIFEGSEKMRKGILTSR